VTAEFKKQKYTYYRCTGYRGKCDLPYFREEAMAERLGQVLQAIQIPDDILGQLEESLVNDKGREETLRGQQAERFRQRLAQLRKRLDQAYVDRLDGKITEEFWGPSPPNGRRTSKHFAHRCASSNRRKIPSVRSTAFAFENSRVRRILCTLRRLRRKKRNCWEWCYRTALWTR
jgi:hypothetical protein